MVGVKAAWAATRRFVRVNPAYTPRHAVVVGTPWLPTSGWVSLIGYSIVRIVVCIWIET